MTNVVSAKWLRAVVEARRAELEAVGDRYEVSVRGGVRRFVNLDNAATTPALTAVERAVERALPLYGAVHRGTGFKSELSTELYQRCRDEVGAFVGADPARHAVVFGRSTTELLNLLAHGLGFSTDDVVIVSGLEHHSNDLPWRRAASVVRVEAEADGTLSEQAVEACFRGHRGRARLLAVTGASNVTGYAPDIDRLARIAHRHGAAICVDAAQLVAHRALDVSQSDVDFVAFSGHKMYAPFGSGALVGLRKRLERMAPLLVGGGTVSVVTPERVWWAPTPFKDEAGTPNLLGALAMAQACRTLSGFSLSRIAERERALGAILSRRLGRIPGLTVYGRAPGAGYDRVGIAAFNVRGLAHGAVAEALSIHYGIGVRSGCFCAQPLVARLLGLPPLAEPPSDEHARPGMVRASLGLCNRDADVSALCDALEEIAADPRAAVVTDGDRRRRREEVSRRVRELFSA